MNEDEGGGRWPGNGREGREAATEGRAGRGRGGQAWAGGQAARAGGIGRGVFIRLCRATEARQASPRQRSTGPVVAMSAPCRATMHGATEAFDHAMTIDAVKSVSFENKKQTMLYLELVLKKC